MKTVEDILMVKGPDVLALDLDATVLEASKLMAEANVGSVIVRQDGQPIGIFTERDLLLRIVATCKDPATTPLSKVMSSPVKSCNLADDVTYCAHVFAEARIRHLVVIEDEALVGVISLRDVQTAQLREAIY